MVGLKDLHNQFAFELFFKENCMSRLLFAFKILVVTVNNGHTACSD